MKQIDKIIKSQSEPKDLNVLWLDISNPEEPILKEYDGGWKTIAGGGAVSYKEQELTSAQKTQARENIDAASTSDVSAISNTVNEMPRPMVMLYGGETQTPYISGAYISAAPNDVLPFSFEPTTYENDDVYYQFMPHSSDYSCYITTEGENSFMIHVDGAAEADNTYMYTVLREVIGGDSLFYESFQLAIHIEEGGGE